MKSNYPMLKGSLQSFNSPEYLPEDAGPPWLAGETETKGGGSGNEKKTDGEGKKRRGVSDLKIKEKKKV